MTLRSRVSQWRVRVWTDQGLGEYGVEDGLPIDLRMELEAEDVP